MDLVDVETDKILSAVTANALGILRRRKWHAKVRKCTSGDYWGLLPVLTDNSDSQIERLIADFQSHYVPEKAEEEARVDPPLRPPMLRDTASATSGAVREPRPLS